MADMIFHNSGRTEPMTVRIEDGDRAIPVAWFADFVGRLQELDQLAAVIERNAV